MKHNARRFMSIVLCLLMMLSMLTAIVLPVSAEEIPAADPYAKVTGTADGELIIPDENVFFIDPAWATEAPAAAGEEFEYTYGDGESWGNGKTYLLTWGENTGVSINDIKRISKEYNAAWSTGDAALVMVVAPGSYGYVNDYNFAAPGGTADPSEEQLMDFYLLGPQAGKSAVSPDKSTKEKAKEVMNDRSSNTETEAAFDSTFWVPGYCDLYMDGFAVTKAARLYGAYSFVNYYFSNLYFADQTTPALNSIFALGGGGRATTLEFKDCYFNMNLPMTDATLTGEDNQLIANKIIIDNCVFAEGRLSASAPKANWQTHHIKIWPNTVATATAAPNFFGEYATKPLIQISNCAAADWESAHLFRFMLDSGNYSAYNNNAVRININNNKFYDVGTLPKSSDIFFMNATTTEDQANSYDMQITENLFSYSDEIFDQGKTGHSYVFNFGKPANVKGYKLKVVDNVFIAPNNKNVSHVSNHDNAGVTIDLSGNLFMDNQGNIQPLFINAGSPPTHQNSHNVLSDIYASDEMKGGVRELMTVTEVENGVAAYCFIQTRRRGNLCNFDYFTGGLTLLLKNGVTYNANTLIKTLHPDVQFMGIYTEETCQTKVDTITQDTINGKFAKLQYKAGKTTLTVVYTLNTPRNYLIVDPNNTYKTNGYTFNGKVYKDGQKTDGVYAKFYANVEAAYNASGGPNCNDLLALTTATFKDKDGQSYSYNNNLNDLIILVPGKHNKNGTDGQNIGTRRSFCIVGPQWGVSPYGENNKEGKLANGRGTDLSKEAVLNMSITPAADQGGVYSVVLDGIAFAGTCIPLNMSHATNNNANSAYNSLLQFNVVKNCVITNSNGSIIGSQHAAANPKVLHMTIKDCVYDATGLDRSKVNNPIILIRSNFCTVENFAVINDNTCTTSRMAYITLTDGSQMRWNAKRTYADFNNIIIYNSKRDGVLYTLRESDGATVNATKEYYPEGAELNINNFYITGGEGYFFGIQGNETQDDFVKLKAMNNYYYRPDYDGNVIAHYQSTNPEVDVYTDDSVFANNTIIVKDTVKMNAYNSDLNVDSNFYGKKVGDKIIATYINGSAQGIVKDRTTYWLDEGRSLKNLSVGLVNNGYKSFEVGEFLGYNQYAIDATNITATPSIFKASNGATIDGVYTDAECTTAATAFTHPQDVYVKVTKGEYTLVNKVALNCACSHDGTTYEAVIQEPTCTVAGSKGNLCEYCDAQIGESIEIPATGEHTLGELIVDTAATCTTTGTGHKDCTVCKGTIETDIVIPTVADAHVWEDDFTVDKEPTCTARGSKSIHCALCDITKEGTALEIPMKDHEWESEFVVDSEPTCQANGSKSIHCADCDIIKEGSQVVIPMGQHVWNDFYTVDVESTCIFSGMESIHCAICDTVKVGSARDLPFSGHSWSEEYVIIKDPTCTEKGIKAYECTECYTINEDSIVEIEVLEHEWQDWLTIDKEADCTTDGLASYHCYHCDATNNAVVLPAGHLDVVTAYIVIPTYQEGGIEGDICTVCGTVINQWAVDAVEGEMADTVFEDVDENDWFYKNDAVNFVYNEGLMNGTTATTFSPDATLTRGMFVTILGRLVGVDENGSGKTAFKDVDANAYYAPYVKWAAEEGIVNGFSATEFRPAASITREQICKMILEFCNAEGITVVKTEKKITFKDASDISSYAKKYVEACQMSGLVNGSKSGNGYVFRPKATASRAEAATIIRNFCYAYLIK